MVGCTFEAKSNSRTPSTRSVRLSNDTESILTIAVEEAIRLREKSGKLIESITALSVGPPKSVDTIRTALAMGADSGIHITTPENAVVEPISVAHAIKAVLAKDSKYDLIIMGKQAIDDDSGSTGGMLAGMLNWPQASFASKLEVAEGGAVNVTREIDGGLEKIETKLPVIVTTDLRCVYPPLSSLSDIILTAGSTVRDTRTHTRARTDSRTPLRLAAKHHEGKEEEG